ncbi:Brix domain-containing protein [Entophlyctis helioformis]|nr:Brix domain-containing protein [Entophlyctis helioformis]
MIRIKAKTAAGARILKKREPTLIEGAKTAVFLKGTTTSQVVSDALKDLTALKKPDAVAFQRRNDIHPFDDPKPFEFLSAKNDAALFVLATHSKKRPHNLVFVRMFDHQMLDMVELGITNMALLEEFKNSSVALGNRPLVLFSGEHWESSDEMRTVKSILLDMYTGDKSVDQIDLRGLSHIVSFTSSVPVVGGPVKVYMRVYTTQLMKSGVKLPRVELKDMGPHFNFDVRRVHVADAEVMKIARKIPKELKVKKEKNVEKNEFGERVGRVWLDKQDMSGLQTRKMKGLKRKAGEDDDQEDDETAAGQDTDADEQPSPAKKPSAKKKTPAHRQGPKKSKK